MEWINPPSEVYLVNFIDLGLEQSQCTIRWCGNYDECSDYDCAIFLH